MAGGRLRLQLQARAQAASARLPRACSRARLASVIFADPASTWRCTCSSRFLRVRAGEDGQAQTLPADQYDADSFELGALREQAIAAGGPEGAAAAFSAAVSAGQADGSPPAAPDKWEQTLAVNHTLSSLYLRRVEVQPFKQLDHEQRRRDKELAEICQAGRRLGISESLLRDNMAQLEKLLPDLHPNLDQMKASDWAKVLRDLAAVTLVVITLREEFPGANVSALLRVKPKLLLQQPGALRADAEKVKAMLGRLEDVDSVVEAVPYLLDPAAVAQSLDNLRRWFPDQDPFVVLQNNPKLLVNISEADLEADPLYGYVVGG